jgi:hypothetical protein
MKNNSVQFNCCYCGKVSHDRLSHYKLKKRHFCSRKCYSDFRRDLLPKEEQHAYGSGYSLAERVLRKKCREILNHAIRDGKIKRGKCVLCGKKAEAHHLDYTNPLKIAWLCFNHHRKVHENPELLKGSIK